MIAMTLMLIALGIVSTVISRSFSVRARESRTADALATAQGAISVLSREVSNSGFGLFDGPTTKRASNGIVLAESNAHRIRVRANLENEGGTATAPGPTTTVINAPAEDVTYFFDSATNSIVRYDPNGLGTNQPLTSVVVNQISNVRIIVDVNLDPVAGQPDGQRVTFASDVTLRNNKYMLQQY